jgi:hypothetical protein
LVVSEEDVNINIPLTPPGSIDGKVVDEYGEPLENVVVSVYRSAISDGERTVTNVGTAWTDDRGAFRLTSLRPGEYYVKAQGRRGGTETHFGIDGMRYASWEAFSPVYLGDATELKQATPVTIAAGTRVTADFHLELQSSSRIRGKLEGYSGPDTVTFELLGEDSLTEPSRAVIDAVSGRFVILDATPGDYTLRASQQNTRGELLVHVGEGDTSGNSLVLAPPITVNGVARSVGDAVTKPEVHGSCSVALYQHQYSVPVSASNTPQAPEQFVLSVFPGEYRVRLKCYGAYPVSASFGNADLLKNPLVAFSPSSASQTMVIEFRSGGGVLNVKFANEIPPQAGVLLIPRSSPSSDPLLLPAYARGGPEGAIRFANLAPGDYSVYLFPRYEAVEFRSPEFLEKLSGGTSAHIEDGQTAEVVIAGASQ